MHIKDLESVFNAQTPWKSDSKYVRATACLGVEQGRKVEWGVRSPNLLFHPRNLWKPIPADGKW